MTSAEFASALNFAFQRAYPCYFHNTFYTIEMDGRKYEVARTKGKGRNAGNWYLHVKKEITVTLKSPDGTILDTYIQKERRHIELHNARAEWRE